MVPAPDRDPVPVAGLGRSRPADRVFGGAVIATFAGARRSDTAYHRFVVAERAADLNVYGEEGSSVANLGVGQVQALPELADLAEFYLISTDQPDIELNGMSDGYGLRFNRFKLLSGREPDPGRTDEVMIGFSLAERRHLRVGSTLTVGLLKVSAGAEDQGPTPPQPVAMRVVGVEAGLGEFPPYVGTGNLQPWVSPAFLRDHRDSAGTHVMSLRLKHRADATAVNAKLQGLGQGKPVAKSDLAGQAVSVQASLHLQALAIRILAALAGLTVALVCGQLLARTTTLESVEHPALVAVGTTRRQLAALAWPVAP